MSDITVIGPSTKRCSVAGCSKQAVARKMCPMHWARQRREPGFVSLFERSAKERLLGKTRVVGGCWLWTGAIGRGGYGYFGVEPGKGSLAHRASYELFRGPIPAGLHLDHLCRVRSCVNPWHLEAVTQKENNRRSDAWSAVSQRLGVCARGHSLSSENLYVSPDGKRRCRACRAIRQQQQKEMSNVG